MKEFILTSVSLERTPEKLIKDTRFNVPLYMEPEKLKVTINFIASGDSKSVSSEILFNEIVEKLNKL